MLKNSTRLTHLHKSFLIDKQWAWAQWQNEIWEKLDLSRDLRKIKSLNEDTLLGLQGLMIGWHKCPYQC